jgi:hypothetical protein
VSAPIPAEQLEGKLPLDSMISISPDLGQPPKVSSVGSIQIAGQSQSPFGSFALTSTLPYLKLNESFVLTLALYTDGFL